MIDKELNGFWKAFKKKKVYPNDIKYIFPKEN